MRKQWLLAINAVLGAMALVLAGCGAQSRTVKNRGSICMYGIPQEILDQRQAREDSLRQAQPEQPADSLTIQPADTISIQSAPERPDSIIRQRPMVKYGPRPV